MIKYFITFLLVVSSLNIFSQNNYTIGFNNGYKEGYCYGNSYGCIAPIPPICPIPKIGESYDNYSQGYNRGFVIGQKQQSNSNKNNNLSTSDSYLEQNKLSMPEAYFPQVDYNPDYIFLIAAASKIQNNYIQNNYEDAYIEQLKKNLEERGKKLSSERANPELIEKRINELYDAKIRYGSYKYLPKIIPDGMHKVMLSRDFQSNPSNPCELKEKYAIVKNNKIWLIKKDKDNFKDDLDTYCYVDRNLENERNLDNYIKYMEDNNIAIKFILNRTNFIDNGVGVVNEDILYYKNSKIVLTSEEDNMLSTNYVVFFDYLEEYNNAQKCINLIKSKHKKYSKIKIKNGWNVVQATNNTDFCNIREVFVSNNRITKYKSGEDKEIIIDSGGKIVNGKTQINYNKTIYSLDKKSQKNITVSLDIYF